MLSILYYIWLAAICTVVLVLSVAVLALTYPFQKSRRIVHEMSRYLALSFLLPFPRRVEGLENVDRRERYVIVLNHQAMVDIGALYHVPLNFRWVSKREVFRIPFFGQFLLVHGDICIDRGHAAEALEQLVRDGKKWISRGASVAIFPEGTRSKDGEIHRFKAGAFTLAKEAGGDPSRGAGRNQDADQKEPGIQLGQPDHRPCAASRSGRTGRRAGDA